MRGRLAVLLLAFALMAAGPGRPATIFVGSPHEGSIVYGPADMLCDLFKCRLFGLPDTLKLEPNAIVEFGLPELSGQGRIDLRRCLQQICRASVLGYASARTSAPGHGNPTVFITPIELRLE